MKIRPATTADYASFARLMPELGVPDLVPPAESWWTQRGATTLIAERNGLVVGYAYYEVFDSVLYVRNVVSAPEARRTGVGRALMEALEAIARREGMSEWQLNVKDDNVAAIELYRSLGFVEQHVTYVLVLEWATVGRLPSVSGVRVSSPDSERDHELEARYGLASGFVDRRRRSGVHILVAEAAGHHAGFAVFDPSFPGAYPFRASSDGSARALLESMHTLRVSLDTDQAWRRHGVQLVVEDDGRLTRSLLDLNAEQRFRILNLRAQI